MLTREQINLAMCAILTTIADVEDGAPSGTLYMALQTADANAYTLDAYYRVLSLLTESGCVTVEHNIVAITGKGRALAAKIEAHARRAS